MRTYLHRLNWLPGTREREGANGIRSDGWKHKKRTYVCSRVRLTGCEWWRLEWMETRMKWKKKKRNEKRCEMIESSYSNLCQLLDFRFRWIESVDASQRGIKCERIVDIRVYAYDISMQNAWQPFSVIFIIIIFIVFDYGIYMKWTCIAVAWNLGICDFQITPLVEWRRSAWMGWVADDEIEFISLSVFIMMSLYSLHTWKCMLWICH